MRTFDSETITRDELGRAAAWTPVRRDRFPRVSRAMAAATRKAAAVTAALPVRLAVSLRGLGTLSLYRVALDWGGSGACETWQLLHRGQAASLELDRRLALSIAAFLLGAPAARTDRALTPAERGLVTAFLAEVLEAFGTPLTVALLPPEPAAAPAGLRLGCHVKLVADGGGPFAILGWARLTAGEAWCRAVDPRPHETRLARVPFPVVVQGPRTQLERQWVARLQAGDVVVFDGHPPARALESAALALGHWAAPACLRTTPDGQGWHLQLAGAFICSGAGAPPVAPAGARLTDTGGNRMADTNELPQPEATALDAPTATHRAGPEPGPVTDERRGGLARVLGTTAVEVVAELGRLTLTGDELAGLTEGTVLALAGAARGPITLSVAGRPIAEGELVDVEGTFGVRISRVT